MRSGDDDDFDLDERLDRDMEREPLRPEPVPVREDGLERSALIGRSEPDETDDPFGYLDGFADSDEYAGRVSNLGQHGEG